MCCSISTRLPGRRGCSSYVWMVQEAQVDRPLSHLCGVHPVRSATPRAGVDLTHWLHHRVQGVAEIKQKGLREHTRVVKRAANSVLITSDGSSNQASTCRAASGETAPLGSCSLPCLPLSNSHRGHRWSHQWDLPVTAAPQPHTHTAPKVRQSNRQAPCLAWSPAC